MLHALLYIVSRKTRQRSAKQNLPAEPLPIIVSEIVREIIPNQISGREKWSVNFLCAFAPIGINAPTFFKILLLWPWFKKEVEAYSIIPWTFFGVAIVSLLLGIAATVLSSRKIVGFFKNIHKWPLDYAAKEFVTDSIYIGRLKRSTLVDLQTARRT